MSLPTVGFAGMTHLGINSAAAVAARGFDVVGYDDDQAVIEKLKRKDLIVAEPELDDLVAAHWQRFHFSADREALRRCDVVYISADVPTDDQGRSDLTNILRLVDDVCSAMNDHAILVVLSQVPPGFCRAITAIPHSRLYYQVETLVFGRAVERATKPERYIVGCAEPGDDLPRAFKHVLAAFSCPILPMRYESAELAKISINMCLVASVSVANTLAEVSEAIGADWSEIAPALKLDKRIGAYSYLAPGLGISGGNLERDLRTIINIGKARETNVALVEACIENSTHRKDWTWRTLSSVLSRKPDAAIAVLGLAYKENTHSTKNSPSLQLLSHLQGRTVRVYDPIVPATVAPFATPSASALECLEGADVAVLVTPWPEFKGLKREDLETRMRGRTVIDPYRLLDGKALQSRGFSYHTLGAPPLSAH